MTLIINGEPRDVADGVTVAALIESLDLTANRVAVEVNRQLIRRQKFAETPLAANDTVEVVTFVGGG